MEIFRFLFLITVFAKTLSQTLNDEWLKYKKVFNLSFNSADDAIFKQNFAANLAKINSHNLKYQLGSVSFKLKITKFTHKSNNQSKYSPDTSNTGTNYFELVYNLLFGSKKTPQQLRINWLEKGFVSPVGDQAECNSCYAFAVGGAVESAYAIKNSLANNVPQFSKQQIVDCTTGSNFRCNGGILMPTLAYTQKTGLMKEASYKYEYVYGNESFACRENKSQIVAKIKSSSVMLMSKSQILDALQNSPVVASFFSTDDFLFYDTGVYDSSECVSKEVKACAKLNHAVLITGFDVVNGSEYWIVKNSWGNKWGENGFFKIKAGVNMCCIELSTFKITL